MASGAILAASLAVVGDRAGSDERGFEMGRFDAMNLFGWIAGYAFGLGVEARLPRRELGASSCRCHRARRRVWPQRVVWCETCRANVVRPPSPS